jgi:hypothetical protein
MWTPLISNCTKKKSLVFQTLDRICMWVYFTSTLNAIFEFTDVLRHSDFLDNILNIFPTFIINRNVLDVYLGKHFA